MEEMAKKEVETEVRRLLSVEATAHRELIEKMFKLALGALGVIVAVAIGSFFFLVGDSIQNTRDLIGSEARAAQELMKKEIEQRVLEYRIADELKGRLEKLADNVLATRINDRLQGETLNELVTRAVDARVSSTLSEAPCRNQPEQCICRIDGGSDKAKLELCLSRCEDGRLASLRIKTLTSTSDNVSCGQLGAIVEFF